MDKVTIKNYHKNDKFADKMLELSAEQEKKYVKKVRLCQKSLLEIAKAFKKGEDEYNKGWDENIREEQEDGSVITLHQRDGEDGLKYTKITSHINVPAKDALRWSSDMENIPKFDDYIKNMCIHSDLSGKIPTLSKNEENKRGYGLAKVEIHGVSYVVTGRDFVVVIGFEELDNGICLAPMTSVEHEGLPPTDLVRGNITNHGSIFIPDKDKKGCTVINVNHIDMNGWIPASVMNLITNNIDVCKRMRKSIQSEFK
eukprot:CAMPEP_0117423626 /NCGR_PEP_ID=MMETSP0758-20121206/4198_1 /TAXON_ID=63605 /ORGANISM="Percolomonas cosmopolitus, Strain AE-1 (ATCC 50343)" /LENGTH=255 /DNA_ID=CAMNT_0005206899 /DNA_START=20 /DNA_END=787 /DNA_ORIENTATION=+